MKKIKFLLLGSLLVFSMFSCTSPDDVRQHRQDYAEYLYGENATTEIIPDDVENAYGHTTVVHFEYNGHKYIVFVPSNNNDRTWGVHDPDCPCHQNEGELIESSM